MEAEFLTPDNRGFDPFEDWERGGIAHQDPSQGIDLKDWRAWKDRASGWILVQPVDLSQPPIQVHQEPNATFISLAFDRNMRLVVAWRVVNTSYLYWFEPITNTYTITSYPSTHSPRLSHDDKRERASQWSDVLFFYIRAGQLCVRTQRDRYEIETILAEVGDDVILYRVGMNTKLRMQLELR